MAIELETMARGTIGLLCLAMACKGQSPDSTGGGGESDTARVVAVLPVSARDSVGAVGETTVWNGGFGSAIALHKDRFYILTDRGPNYDYGEETKAFPAPSVGPQVGVFERQGDHLRLVHRIRLRNPDGSPISGMPHPRGRGATGERAVAPDGTPLALDPNGLDPEGLHVLDDGSFWIADEYGPSLVHFDPSGTLIRRVTPYEPAGRALPAVLAKRRPNYGFEGLTGDSAGRVLVAIVQSPLDNPRAGGEESILVRIVTYDTETGVSRQYLYPLDAAGYFATDITWISPTSFLVLERDVGFGGGWPPARQKKVFRVDLSDAPDVSDSTGRASGRLAEGKTLEEASTSELFVSGAEPATKTLVVDLLDLEYPHDKPEGIVLLSPNEIGVINDDDFGITSAGGRPVPKRLPSSGTRDSNALWIIRLPIPLR